MKKGKGFSLIEVLVVIAIIALVLALVIPSMNKARRQAMNVVCQSHLKQWGTIFSMYSEDNDFRFLRFMGDALWFIRGSQLEAGDPNLAPMSTYVNAKGIGCCPMAASPPDDSKGWFSMKSSSPLGTYEIKGITGSTFESWKIKSPVPEFCGSYGFNMDLFRPTFYSGVRISQQWLSGINALKLDRAYRFPVLLDCTSPGDSIDDKLPILALAGHTFCIDRHDGCINGLFMDWSVRKIGLKELWTLKWNENFDTANRWTLSGGVKPEKWPAWMRGFKDY